MSTEDARKFNPEAPKESEIGWEMVNQSTGLGSVLAHFYRGEMDRVTTWRRRLDETTTWAVTVIAALLAFGFSTSGSPSILLAAIIVTLLFLVIEARRYQDYDVFRSRVRIVQENLFANALDPSAGVEQRDWRRQLSEDLRDPSLRIPFLEAIARRLHRIYLPLLFILLGAWLFRLTTVAGGRTWVDNATIGVMPGNVVFGIISVFYLSLVWVTYRPRSRHAREDFDRL